MCQENAGTNLAPALRECYNTTRLITRDYRLPADINVLIDIMRRIEDENSFEDARELSYQILHRYDSHYSGLIRILPLLQNNLKCYYNR